DGRNSHRPCPTGTWRCLQPTPVRRSHRHRPQPLDQNAHRWVPESDPASTSPSEHLGTTSSTTSNDQREKSVPTSPHHPRGVRASPDRYPAQYRTQSSKRPSARNAGQVLTRDTTPTAVVIGVQIGADAPRFQVLSAG